MDSHPYLREGQEQPGEEWFEVKDGVGVWMGGRDRNKTRRTKGIFHSLYCRHKLIPNGLRNLKTIYTILCWFDMAFHLEAGNKGGMIKGKQWRETQTAVLFSPQLGLSRIKDSQMSSFLPMATAGFMILVINIRVPYMNLGRQSILQCDL